MKKWIGVASIAMFLLSGCDSKSSNKENGATVLEKTSQVATTNESAKNVVESANETAKNVVESANEVAQEVNTTTQNGVKKVDETVVEPTKETAKETAKVATTNATTNTQAGATLFKPCIACHGAKAEKQALGKSHIIAGWETQKTIDALNGYKNKTYGGAMKTIMYGQTGKLTQEQISQLATYISTL